MANARGGSSAIGDESLDARLPFTERFEIPQSAIDAIQKGRLTGGRVIAVGTTVVRALEGCSAQNGGHLIAGAGETDLIIGPRFRRSVVDGILTGLHDPEQSHFQLLRSFADEGISAGRGSTQPKTITCAMSLAICA